MPEDRLNHPRIGRSNLVSQLSHLEYRVWDQYRLSSDDYGVMPESSALIRGANLALEREDEPTIQQALAKLVDVGLVHRFEHQGVRYLYSRNWQTHQKIRYPRETHHPCPPARELKQCDDKTLELFSKRSGKISETPPENSGTPSAPPTRAHTRNADANANASVPAPEPPSAVVDPHRSLITPLPRNTAWPGRPPVPGFLHQELLQRLGPNATERDLFAFYTRTSEAWTDKAIGDDSPKFWRARFNEWQGTTVNSAMPQEQDRITRPPDAAATKARIAAMKAEAARG